eukprot:6213563-Pleurochrysis_carterae.AAC.1
MRAEATMHEALLTAAGRGERDKESCASSLAHTRQPYECTFIASDRFLSINNIIGLHKLYVLSS